MRDRRLPDIWEANRVTTVAVVSDEAIEGVLARAEREYAGFGHRRFDLDFTTPPAFEARLVLEGYRAREFLVMVLEGCRSQPRCPSPVPRIASGKMCTSSAF